LDDLVWLEIGKGMTPIRITKRWEVWILFESLNEPWCLNPKRITMNKDNTLIIKADLDFMMGDFQNN
jgi:hypothetical protein